MTNNHLVAEFSTTDVELLPVPNALITSVSQGTFASREMYNLRLLAEHALLVSGFDELISLSQLQFSPFDYQLRAAQTMLRRFRGRGMFCDEVGLGKTIEAGLVIKEYLTRNVVQRVMVVTPAGWKEPATLERAWEGFDALRVKNRKPT